MEIQQILIAYEHAGCKEPSFAPALPCRKNPACIDSGGEPEK